MTGINIMGYEIDQWLISYVVLLFPFMISWYFSMGIARDLFTSSLRATVQLIMMGLILIPVFNSNIYIHLLLLLIMILYGSYISRERGKNIPFAFLIGFISISFPFMIVFSVLLLSQAVDSIPKEFIPISGMFIGNASRTVSMIYHKAYNDFEANQSTIEAMLIDGATRQISLKLPLKITLKNAMVPQIDNLKTLGMVHIPGAMAGLIVAGADPLVAAGYQIVIFFGIVSISALSSMTAVFFVYNNLFSKYYPHLKKAC